MICDPPFSHSCSLGVCFSLPALPALWQRACCQIKMQLQAALENGCQTTDWRPFWPEAARRGAGFMHCFSGNPFCGQARERHAVKHDAAGCSRRRRGQRGGKRMQKKEFCFFPVFLSHKDFPFPVFRLLCLSPRRRLHALCRALCENYLLLWVASIASITAARIPPRSSVATPRMVVPAGEQTASFIAPGCSPVSSCRRPVPAIICAARR